MGIVNVVPTQTRVVVRIERKERSDGGLHLAAPEDDTIGPNVRLGEVVAVHQHPTKRPSVKVGDVVAFAFQAMQPLPQPDGSSSGLFLVRDEDLAAIVS